MSSVAKRILVTAADTPVGAALITALLADPAIEQVLAVHGLELAPQVSAPDARLVRRHVDQHHTRTHARLLQGEAHAARIDAVVHDIANPHHHADSTRHLLQLCEEQPTIETIVLRSMIDVYRVSSKLPVLIDEDHPLDIGTHNTAQRVLLEGDLYACSHMPSSRLRIVVLRCAQLLAPDCDSTLFDYLCAPVCLRALGFDPMLNVLSLQDITRVLLLALHAQRGGVFNVPGRDSLPLSELIFRAGRRDLPLPGAFLSPLYWLREKATGALFQYAPQRGHFHQSGILDGRRAHHQLGYTPEHAIDFAQLAREVAARIRRTR